MSDIHSLREQTRREPDAWRRAGEIVCAVTALRSLFRAEPQFNRLENLVDTVDGYRIVSVELAPVSQPVVGGTTVEECAPDGKIIAKSLESLPVACKRVYQELRAGAALHRSK